MKSHTRKHIAMLMILAMLFTILPMGVVWAESTIMITNENKDGKTASFEMHDEVLYLNSQYQFQFSSDFAHSGNIINEGTVVGGTIQIERGQFYNHGTITGGTFQSLVINEANGTITGGTFNGKILNLGGTIADNVNGTVAQGGPLKIIKKNYGYGTGAIAVKQKGVDIPRGKAGEVYNIAGFDPDELVGLYLLKDGETIPSENYSIDTTVYEPVEVLGRLVQYNFTMPNEDVTIAAVFSNYVPPTTINLYAMIVEGTSAEQLKDGDILYDFAMPTVTGTTTPQTLTMDTVGEYITVDGIKYKFAGFDYYIYDEATDTGTYSVADTYVIGAEPTIKESEAWFDWYAPISEGIYVVYMPVQDSPSYYDSYVYVEPDPVTELRSDTVHFEAAEDVALPYDAELVVESYTATLAPIAGSLNSAVSYETVEQDGSILGRITVGKDAAGSRTREQIVADWEAAQKAYHEHLDQSSIVPQEVEAAYRNAKQELARFDAIAQLGVNKNYNVSVVGASDISIENATAVSGTVTRTFEVAEKFVGNENVKYIAVHDTATGAEFGTVNVAADGKTLIATYEVNNFSPFIVYAFEAVPTQIILQIDNPVIQMGSTKIISDVPPVIVDDRTIVPIAIITDLLGGRADWNADIRQVTLTIDDKVLTMSIGEVIPGVGTAPFITDGRTMVPIAYIMDYMGFGVTWDEDTRRVVIEK